MRDQPTSNVLWILAFDGSCGRCRRISEAIEQASRGRLEVRPLADREVRLWREQALGTSAPWAPTVLNVEADRARAWTGPMLGVRLAARLGPLHTIRVLQALGELRSEASTDQHAASDQPHESVANNGIRRRGLLRLGTGIGVGVGLMLSGTAPAFAASNPRKLAAARAWATDNQTPRAGQYGEFAGFDLAHRKAIFDDLAPSVRRGLWTEQFSRFRRTHTDLGAEQIRLLDEAETLLAESTLFTDPAPDLRQRVQDLEASAINAFGRSRACGLFSTLGSTHGSRSDPHPLTCTCSVGSTCDGAGCQPGPCAVGSGCGCFWAWPCDGCLGCV